MTGPSTTTVASSSSPLARPTGTIVTCWSRPLRAAVPNSSPMPDSPGSPTFQSTCIALRLSSFNTTVPDDPLGPFQGSVDAAAELP